MSHRLPSNESSQFFSRLTPTQFEELCHDLIIKLGYKRVSWRKGSSGEHSPSDGSRDIEAYWVTEDPDGVGDEQLWLIDAKHVTTSHGLNRAKVADFLSLGSTFPQAKLLVMTSGYVSNSLRDEFALINSRGTSVRVWERHRIIEFVTRYHELLHKYNLSEHLDFLMQFHPLHVTWMREVPIVSEKMIDIFSKFGMEIHSDACDALLLDLFGIYHSEEDFEAQIKAKYNEMRQVSRLIAGRVIIDRFLYHAFNMCDTTKIEWQRSVMEKMLSEHPDWAEGHMGEMLGSLYSRSLSSRTKYVKTCEALLPLFFEIYNTELKEQKQKNE